MERAIRENNTKGRTKKELQQNAYTHTHTATRTQTHSAFMQCDIILWLRFAMIVVHVLRGLPFILSFFRKRLFIFVQQSFFSCQLFFSLLYFAVRFDCWRLRYLDICAHFFPFSFTFVGIMFSVPSGNIFMHFYDRYSLPSLQHKPGGHCWRRHYHFFWT